MQLLSALPSQTILLIEDVDAAFVEGRKARIAKAKEMPVAAITFRSQDF